MPFFKLSLIVFALASSLCDGYTVLPFGAMHGDSLNPKIDDGCGEKLALPDKFSFYSKSYDSIWVCNNGILSFSGATNDYTPKAFPSNHPWICIFWADIDNRVILADGNDIYWRMDQKRSTLEYLNGIITSNTATGSFQSAWVFVATWYKVGYFSNGVDLLNTFQVVLTCDSKNRCFSLFAYDIINWTNTGSQGINAQAGFNDGTGNYEVLPGSMTSSVRNLVVKSNVGVNGLFIYKVTETGVDDNLGCSAKMEPRLANMFFEPNKFTLEGYLCDRQNVIEGFKELPVVFIGRSFKITTRGFISKDRKIITGKLPFWGTAEQVRVLPVLEGIQMREAVTMQFLGPSQKSSTQKHSNSQVHVTQSGSKKNDEIFIKFKWDSSYWTSVHGIVPSNVYVTLYVVKFVEEDVKKAPFKIQRFMTKSMPNTGQFEITSSLKEGSVFVVIDSQQGSKECFENEVKSFADCGYQPLGTVSPALIKVKQSASKTWYKREKQILELQKKPWFEKVGETFGCPRNSIERRGRSDSWFARTEVTSGLNGWEFDPCCGPANDVINPHCFGCQQNKGADFCIQSPGLMVEERDESYANYLILASNQCCYGKNGRLLTSQTDGAGNAKKSVNSAGTYLEFINNEISPFLACEEEKKLDLYYEVRPIIKGIYVPRRTVVNWGDPHMKTLDGFEYTFNGLGVYVMTKTGPGLANNLTMQVSTRRVGNGTVFNGFAIQDRFTSIEFFLTSSNDVMMSINGSDIDVDDVMRLTQDGVLYKKDVNSTEFAFKMIQSDFIVKAVTTQNGVLNLGLSPPIGFQGNLQGLLGNYDGNAENDLLSANGTLISTSSSLMTIHEEFGNSWQVAEKDWLFSLQVAGLVKEDIAKGLPYTPVYTPQFESEDLRRQAEELCGDDSNCLMDTALTGQIEFAENAVDVKTLIEATEVLNQVVEEYSRGVNGASVVSITFPFLIFILSYASIKLFRRFG